jgi:hypothetical protein
MTCDNFRHRQESLLDGGCVLVPVSIDLDPDHHGQAQADPAPVQFRSIACDHATLLKSLDSPQTRRRRQANALRQIRIGESPVVLQDLKNPAIKFIGRFEHIQLISMFILPLFSNNLSMLSEFRKIMPLEAIDNRAHGIGDENVAAR